MVTPGSLECSQDFSNELLGWLDGEFSGVNDVPQHFVDVTHDYFNDFLEIDRILVMLEV
jgi:hypothetical protein